MAPSQTHPHPTALIQAGPQQAWQIQDPRTYQHPCLQPRVTGHHESPSPLSRLPPGARAHQPPPWTSSAPSSSCHHRPFRGMGCRRRLRFRIRHHQLQYLVQWTGHGQATWEPSTNLDAELVPLKRFCTLYPNIPSQVPSLTPHSCPSVSRAPIAPAVSPVRPYQTL